MASCFENISLLRYNEIAKCFDKLIENIDLKIEISQRELILYISNKTGDTLNVMLNLNKINSWKLSPNQLMIETEMRRIGNCEMSNFLLEFHSETDLIAMVKRIEHHRNKLTIKDKKDSTSTSTTINQFDNRTEKWSATQYFQFYSYLSQQQNMMQDYVRTATYQRAVLSNCTDFRNKVVLDVGAGSGILSFFAAQAGAKKVYAVEASNMAKFCEQLVQNNKLAGKIIVVSGKIEEIQIPEPVDILISEPMGYMLFNERMLETYVHARKFLKPGIGCLMYPTVANLYIAPFSDEALYMEQASKANFWYQQAFHGVDLSSVRECANKENFSQPIVDTFDMGICMAPPLAHRVDFRTISEEELHTIDIALKFSFHQTGCCHGLAIWFDVGFLGGQKDVWLSTAPTEPLTHWYQVRCLFVTPLFVYEGQAVQGRMAMRANARQSYDVDIELSLPGTSCKVANCLDLKNPYFRYTGQPVQQPPGNQTRPPTENYFNMYTSNNNSSQSDNAMDYNNQQPPSLPTDPQNLNCSPLKNQVSWSGDSFSTNTSQPSLSFLQTTVANGDYAPISPFTKQQQQQPDHEEESWGLSKHM